MSASIHASIHAPSGMVRLAELLAAVSLATDLADDAPFESALGDALTALQLARLAGLDGELLTDVYYLALLYHLGCTAAADRQARVGAGDDVSSRRWFSEADFTDRGQLLRLAATRVAQEWGPAARAQAVAALLTAPKDSISNTFAAICEVGARLGERLGVSSCTLALAVQSQIRTPGGRIGVAFLVVAGLGQALAALFDIRHDVMHNLAGAMGMVGLPVAAMLISVSVGRNPKWSPVRRRLPVMANLTWISVILFAAAFIVLIATFIHVNGGLPTQAPPALPHGVIGLVG